MTECRIVGSIQNPREIGQYHSKLSLLEYRADFLGDTSLPDGKHLQQQTIYALRHCESGGRGTAGGAFRTSRLCRAGFKFDFVELDFNRDLHPEVLNSIPPEKRIIAWYGPSKSYEALRRLYGRMRCIPAAYYKIVPKATVLEDGLAPLYLLRTIGPSNVIIYTAGEAGTWTRILSPFLGSPLAYAKLSERGESYERGALPFKSLVQDYGLPHLRHVNILFGLAGKGILQSSDPMHHNRGYHQLQLPAMFLPFHCEDRDLAWFDRFTQEVQRLLGFDIRGVSLGRPFKEAAIAKIGPRRSSRMAWLSKGASVMVRKTGRWFADTAEAQCLTTALTQHGTALFGRKAAVLGCGGAGRAAAVALTRQGSQVTLYNRSLLRGKWASMHLDLPFLPFSAFEAKGYDIVINATPLGKHHDRLPISLSDFDGLVIDYETHTTPLVTEARRMGLTTIDGRELLNHRISHQFHLMTGRELPVQALPA